jgi:hypothetical protein
MFVPRLAIVFLGLLPSATEDHLGLIFNRITDFLGLL